MKPMLAGLCVVSIVGAVVATALQLPALVVVNAGLALLAAALWRME